MVDDVRDATAARVASAVRRVAGSRAEFIAELVPLLAAEIPPLPHDDDIRALLSAAADESVAAGMYMLEHGIDPRTLGAPQAATQYARRLAQRGVPVSVLLRAYRLGHSAFVEMMLAEIAGDPEVDTAEAAAASVALLRATTAYVDTVSELLVVAYENEREAWSAQHSMERTARMNALLDGRDVDVEATETALGYRLRQNHVAVLLWFDDGERGADLRLLNRVAAVAAGTRPHLLVPTDEASAALWLGVKDELVDLSPVATALSGAVEPAPRVALGGPARGVAGFRESHRQAGAARQVALAAGRRAGPVTTFADVGAIALLCADLEATRLWVAHTLGGLADDDENNERLRETVRVFLNLGSSHTAAAEQLNLHKNSVQYRVQKAEALRGRPLRTDRADVELALRACHVLGPAVLRPAGPNRSAGGL